MAAFQANSALDPFLARDRDPRSRQMGAALFFAVGSTLLS
jgi:hypothetical protein